MSTGPRIIAVGHVELEEQVPYLVLDTADEKAGRGAEIPLRADLAADLRNWLVSKLEALHAEARNAGKPLPAKLPHATSLLTMPAGLVRILDRDLVAAGIAWPVKDADGKMRIDKRDDRGRTLDVHALRHTFGTHLSKGGVAPRTAQAAMRHGTLELTMQTYTDPRSLDVVGALNVLPELPLDADPDTEHQRATGTDCRTLVPKLAPKADKRCTSGANVDRSRDGHTSTGIAVTSCADKSNDRGSGAVQQRANGFEPSTFSLEEQLAFRSRNRRSPFLAAV